MYVLYQNRVHNLPFITFDLTFSFRITRADPYENQSVWIIFTPVNTGYVAWMKLVACIMSWLRFYTQIMINSKIVRAPCDVWSIIVHAAWSSAAFRGNWFIQLIHHNTTHQTATEGHQLPHWKEMLGYSCCMRLCSVLQKDSFICKRMVINVLITMIFEDFTSIILYS